VPQSIIRLFTAGKFHVSAAHGKLLVDVRAGYQ